MNRKAQDQGSAEERELLKVNHTIRGRWKVVVCLGSGGFGQIYVVNDLWLENLAALKVEPSTPIHKCQLPMELHVMKILQGFKHSAQLIGAGVDSGCNYIVMQLLGPNLAVLRRRCPHEVKHFSHGTTLRLTLQALEAIRDMHNVGVIHRDIKPDLSRVDDLLSLFYCVYEMLKGGFPWKDKNHHADVLRLKESFPQNVMAKQLDIAEFTPFVNHLEKLTFYDEPNYAMLINLVHQAIDREKISPQDPWDWENNFTNVSAEETTPPS